MDDKIKRQEGMFKPCQSGNPSGMTKSDKTIRDLARVHTQSSLETLSEIVKNHKASVFRSLSFTFQVLLGSKSEVL